jgi:hypothetical protein
MLYREIMAVCSEIHTKHINTLCGQNVEFMNVKLVVHIATTDNAVRYHLLTFPVSHINSNRRKTWHSHTSYSQLHTSVPFHKLILNNLPPSLKHSLYILPIPIYAAGRALQPILCPVCSCSIQYNINLQAPCVLYIGQAFPYSPENAFYIFNQQIYFII